MQNKNKNFRREVDDLARDLNVWWGKTFIYINKTRIKTWKGVFILAFTAGVMAATIWLVSFNIKTISDAAEGATLTVFTDDMAVTLENGSNIVNVDILLNSHSNKVVVAKAVLNYDPAKFELQSWDTANSVFASNNTCIYQGKPCQIVNHDANAGKITITVAKPSPGITTTSGIIGQLVFRAIGTTVPAQPNFTLSYTSGSYADSDVILDDGNGTEILSGVENTKVNVYTAVCSSFNYSAWSECQPNSTQSRTLTASLPSGCFGGSPVLEQSCTYDQTEECTSVTYSDWSECQSDGVQSRTVVSKNPEGCFSDNLILIQSCNYVPPACTSVNYSNWGACQSDNTQTRTIISTSPDNCVPENTILTQPCNYEAPTCTSFTYSAWGDCQPDGTQARTVESSLPAGCTGGKPVTEQDCEYKGGPETCTAFTYSEWGECQPNNTQSRTVTSSLPDNCSGGNPVTQRSCTYEVGSCTSFTYSAWSECRSDGTMTRTALSSSPSGCSGGSPVLSSACQYADKSSDDDDGGDGINSDGRHAARLNDDEKPRFTDLPRFLNKNRGDMIWWEAKDNHFIKYYTYNFNGKKVETRRKHFFIPASTPSGLYMLRVKAYDRAGNSRSRLVTVRVK